MQIQSAAEALRATLLQLVATPDRAWTGVLAGALLLAREFIAPGRVFPGILGGVVLAVSMHTLAFSGAGQDGVSVYGLGLLMIAAAAVALQAWTGSRADRGLAAGLTAVAGARILLNGSGKISWPAALLTLPVILYLGWLLAVGRRAYRNKVEPGEPVSR